jgi:integrase
MEDVRKYPGLMQRGTVYYIRVFVPADLLEVYAPKKEIWRSLRTKSHSEAVQLWRIEGLKFDQEFGRKRSERFEQPKTSLSDTELERLKALYIHEMLASDDSFREEGSGDGPLIEGLAKQLDDADVEFVSPWSAEDIQASFGMSERDFQKAKETVEGLLPTARHALARGNTKLFDWECNEFLKAQGYHLTQGSREFRRASVVLLEATVEALEAQEARLQGKIVKTPDAPPAGLALSQAFERWRIEHQGPQKTANEFLAQIRRFISLHGDLPIDRITKAHVREFKDAMLNWPANLSNAERRRPVPEVLKAYEGLEVPRLSPKTINEKCLAPLKAVLAHCENDGLIESNPAVGIRAKEPKLAEISRLPYSDEDLRTILAFPIFTENARPEGGGGEAAKWLPLLAMFSGSRLEEIAALHREDFGVEDGVQFMRLTRRVKNAASRRKIPIHSQLIGLGFLMYVEGIEAGPIFPLLDGQSEKVSHGWSKWWSRYARANGMTDKRKVFHSFRHTVKKKMRDAGVDKTLRDSVMGHTAEDEAEKYGRDEDGLGFALVPLSQALEAVRYPVSFEHLQPRT